MVLVRASIDDVVSYDEAYIRKYETKRNRTREGKKKKQKNMLCIRTSMPMCLAEMRGSANEMV